MTKWNLERCLSWNIIQRGVCLCEGGRWTLEAKKGRRSISIGGVRTRKLHQGCAVVSTEIDRSRSLVTNSSSDLSRMIL